MYESVNVDKKLERDGIWYSPEPEFRVLLASARAGSANNKYTALTAKLLKPHRRALRSEKFDQRLDETISKLIKHAFARTVVLGWQVVVDDEGSYVDGIGDPDNPGQTLGVNPENIEMILNRYDVLFQDLKDMAESTAAYLKEDLEEDSKN